MKISGTLKEKFIERAVYAVVGGILTAFGFLAVSVWKEVKPQILTHVLPAISNVTLIAIVGLLILVSLLLFVWVLYLLISDTDARKMKQYHFDPETGLYIHKNPSEPFACGKCWPEIRMVKNMENCWKCVSCGLEFDDPKRPAPPKPPKTPPPQIRSSWISGWRS
jgi:rubredoxin